MKSLLLLALRAVKFHQIVVNLRALLRVRAAVLGAWIAAIIFGIAARAADGTAAGMILYETPPSTYVETVEFSELTEQSTRYSTLIRPDGSKMEIINGGIVATVTYPPGIPVDDTDARAVAELQRIQALSQKYPQCRVRLAAATAKWKSAIAFAKAQAATKPVEATKLPGSTPPGLTIITKDGSRYEEVKIGKVEDDTISFTHSAGAATVDLAQLSPELQKRFNYDPRRAEAAKLAKKEASDGQSRMRDAAGGPPPGVVVVPKSKADAQSAIAPGGPANPGIVAAGIPDLGTVFERGVRVRLTKDAPLFFSKQELRIGKAGEEFTVLQHDTATGRVFLLCVDSVGKQIALNVARDAVGFAPFDIQALQASLLALSQNEDFSAALAIVDEAAKAAPQEPNVRAFQASVAAAKAAQDNHVATQKKRQEAQQQIAKLSRDAWMAASSRLDPNGGFARSQQMKAEADKITTTFNAENAKVEEQWVSAKRKLADTLSLPIVSQSGTAKIVVDRQYTGEGRTEPASGTNKMPLASGSTAATAQNAGPQTASAETNPPAIGSSDLAEWLPIAKWGGAGLVVLLLIVGARSGRVRCPQCHHMVHAKVLARRLIDQEQRTKTVMREDKTYGRDRSGYIDRMRPAFVTERQEVVPVTVNTYGVLLKCNRCDHQWLTAKDEEV